jgi:hypothetical protein
MYHCVHLYKGIGLYILSVLYEVIKTSYVNVIYVLPSVYEAGMFELIILNFSVEEFLFCRQCRSSAIFTPNMPSHSKLHFRPKNLFIY